MEQSFNRDRQTGRNTNSEAKPLRIGIDTHSAEQEGSGNSTYMRNLVSQLIQLDDQNEYILFATDPMHWFYRRLADFPKVKIHPIPGSPSSLRVFLFLPLASFQQKIDVLHVQYFAPFFYRGRLVVTIHDLIPFRSPEHFSFYEQILFRIFLPRSAQRAAQILTVSNTSKNDLIKFFNLPPDRITVTYGGVGQDLCLETPLEEDRKVLRRYGVAGKFLLSVGRIDPRKNLARLVEAFSYMKKKFNLEHKLVIIGKVHFEKDGLLKKIRSSEFADDILLPGYVTDLHLPAFYRSAEALIMISLSEGFGLPALEAMGCGTPVVASDIPVFREIFGESAFFVNPLDAEGIAAGIQKVIVDHKLKQGLINNGKEKTLEYTWEAVARAALKAYRAAHS